MKKNRRKILLRSRKILFTILAIILSVSASAQQITASGQVLDARNEPLIGVSVLEKGTSNGTITDIDGHFTLNSQANATLVFSYVGYQSQELKATRQMRIALQEDDQLLEEVVVIGYGTVQRKDVTTAISTVSTKDLEERPITTAGQAIQGKVAGISVIQPSGMPGGDLSIRVRGTTSFNGSNNPLYVVDGVPVDKIDFLSPNDIASMQVMKDASSAAIYGSRAANGVVLITTKTGKKGDAKITLNVQYGMDKVINNVDVLNTQQYLELQKELGNSSLPDGLTDQVNWFDETYQTGQTQSYQASVSDGTDRLRYFLSGGYLDQKGTLDAAFFKRYNFRGNIENDVRKWLKLTANVSYSSTVKNDLITGQGSNRGGVVLAVINTPTYAPIWNPSKPEQYNDNFYGANITHPLENMERSRNNKQKEDRLILSGSALVTLLPELNFKSSFSLDRRNELTTNFLDPVKTGWGRQHFGIGMDGRNRNTIITIDNVATFNKQIKKHSMEAMLGTSYTKSEFLNSWINGTHYRSDAIETLNAANKIDWNNTGSAGSEWGIMSYFGRIAYNYDSRYLLTVNVRRDGSSRLHPDSRWGTFPSMSGGWRISSEKFMEPFSWIDDLKIRVGWGKTGNQSGIHDYAYLQRYTIQRLAWFEEGQENVLPTISSANLRAKDLKWETTTQTNVGIDFTAFNNRLNVTLDYYFKRTKDMLMNVTMPSSGASSISSIQRNEGEMENRGFEVAISTKNIQGKIFSWDTDFNISFNKNELTKLMYTPMYEDGLTSDHVNAKVVRNQPGRPLGSFYGYISDGVDPETGNLIYRDLDKNGVGGNPGDQTFIGDPNPDFTFGMTNTLSWKNFNLSVFLQGSYGNDVYNASRMESEGMFDDKNQTTVVLDRWKIPGQITQIPKAGFNMKNSTYFMEDGSYLRVKTITLSYNFKSKFLSKAGITRLQPYFTANNLLTWTSYSGMDPEVNQWGNSGAVQGIDWGTYPHSKSFVFGINIDF
ncbi:TonB-dependent receptor [uncultured Bacteroides sp.]|uniref:SusC/RagA family TonB-linked outer membrane protein n=1 Tax=uncultured Bacteroides sp. TaxID=162156 RepID=UPI00261C1550|nr:TonB-dependent receptor [uncultured Bacteroides sp.]